MSGRIALVRHGRTEWNAARRMQGTTDIPLDDVGRAQAEQAAAALASLGDWTHVVASPLLRASETAAIIAARLGLPLHAPIAALAERDCGEAEGLSVDEANARWPDLDYPGAETLEQLGRRMSEAIGGSADGAVIVSHGLALRRGIEALTGESTPRIANAEAIVLARAADGTQLRWRRADAALETAHPSP